MIPAALPQVRWLMEPECESSLTGDCFAIARQEGNNTPYHMYYDRHGQILNCPGVDRVIFLKHKHKVRWQRTGLVFYKIFVRSGVITYNLANRVRKLKTLFRASMFPRNMTLSSQHTWILIQSYTCEKAERWATMCRILFNKCHRIVRSQVRSLNVMRCAWWMSRGVLDECHAVCLMNVWCDNPNPQNECEGNMFIESNWSQIEKWSWWCLSTGLTAPAQGLRSGTATTAAMQTTLATTHHTQAQSNMNASEKFNWLLLYWWRGQRKVVCLRKIKHYKYQTTWVMQNGVYESECSQKICRSLPHALRGYLFSMFPQVVEKLVFDHEFRL